MASRVPITDVAKAIHCLEEDGGVILTGFATVREVETVNDDAAPYLEAVAKEVSPAKMYLCLSSLIKPACLGRPTEGNTAMPSTVWKESDSPRDMAAATRSPPDPQPLSSDHIGTIQ